MEVLLDPYPPPSFSPPPCRLPPPLSIIHPPSSKQQIRTESTRSIPGTLRQRPRRRPIQITPPAGETRKFISPSFSYRGGGGGIVGGGGGGGTSPSSSSSAGGGGGGGGGFPGGNGGSDCICARPPPPPLPGTCGPMLEMGPVRWAVLGVFICFWRAACRAAVAVAMLPSHSTRVTSSFRFLRAFDSLSSCCSSS